MERHLTILKNLRLYTKISANYEFLNIDKLVHYMLAQLVYIAHPRGGWKHPTWPPSYSGSIGACGALGKGSIPFGGLQKRITVKSEKCFLQNIKLYL